MIPKKREATIKIPATVTIRREATTSIMFGDLIVFGATIDEAKEALTKELVTCVEASYPVYRWAGSTLFVLYRALGAWNYDVVRQGSNRGALCVMNAKNEAEALAMMERHVSQEIDDLRRATSAAD